MVALRANNLKWFEALFLALVALFDLVDEKFRVEGEFSNNFQIYVFSMQNVRGTSHYGHLS